MDARNTPGHESAAGPRQMGELGPASEVTVSTSEATAPTTEATVLAPGIQEHTRKTWRDQPQRIQVALGPTVTGMIQWIASEQEILRVGIKNAHKETFEVQVMLKTRKSRLDRVFQRVGNIVDGQWLLKAGIDELKRTQGGS